MPAVNKPKCTDPTHEHRRKSNGVEYCYTCLKSNNDKHPWHIPTVGYRKEKTE